MDRRRRLSVWSYGTANKEFRHLVQTFISKTSCRTTHQTSAWLHLCHSAFHVSLMDSLPRTVLLHPLLWTTSTYFDQINPLIFYFQSSKYVSSNFSFAQFWSEMYYLQNSTIWLGKVKNILKTSVCFLSACWYLTGFRPKGYLVSTFVLLLTTMLYHVFILKYRWAYVFSCVLYKYTSI